MSVERTHVVHTGAFSVSVLFSHPATLCAFWTRARQGEWLHVWMTSNQSIKYAWWAHRVRIIGCIMKYGKNFTLLNVHAHALEEAEKNRLQPKQVENANIEKKKTFLQQQQKTPLYHACIQKKGMRGYGWLYTSKQSIDKEPNLLHQNGGCGYARLTSDHLVAVQRSLHMRAAVQRCFRQRAAHWPAHAGQHDGRAECNNFKLRWRDTISSFWETVDYRSTVRCRDELNVDAL